MEAEVSSFLYVKCAFVDQTSRYTDNQLASKRTDSSCAKYLIFSMFVNKKSKAVKFKKLYVQSE